MKGTLDFQLPEERDEFELAQQAWKYKAVVDDFFQYLRTKSKYEDKDTLTIDEIREKLREIKDEYGIID